MTPICFMDTETDGVHPDRKVWEIAIIRRDDEGDRRFHAFVDIDLDTADPFGLKIGGFYERHPYGKWMTEPFGPGTKPTWMCSRDPETQADTWIGNFMPQRAAALQVARWTHGAHIVGAVPNFDTEVLGSMLRDHGLIPAWHYHLIDVENIARGWLLGRGATLNWAATKSDDLSRQCGVEPPSEDDRHTAMGDAEWCMRWWDKLTTTAPQEA